MNSETSTERFSFSTSQPFNVTASSSILGYLGSIAKYWNISVRTLVIILVALGLVIIIIIFALIFWIQKKRGQTKKSWKYKKEPQIPFNDDDFEKYDSPFGYIDMNVMYDKKKKKLKIQNLTVCNISVIGTDIPDCFIKIFLKGKDGKRLQQKMTKTIDDNLNPTFPEIFSLNVENLDTEIVYFQVFDENLNGNDYPMGDGELVLNKLPQENFVGFVYPTYVILKAPTEVLGCGDVCVILTFSPPKLKISILEAKNISFQYGTKNHLPSVYCVVKVFVNGHKKKTFKSRSVSNTKNPYLMETFTMNMLSKDFEVAVIKVEMHETIAGRIPKRIGKLCIGNQFFNPFINELGVQHHKTVLKDWKKPHAMWHSLIKG